MEFRDTERELVERLLRNEPGAARELYRKVAPRLTALFRTQVQTGEDCEELVQDSFLHFLDALPLFQFQSSLTTFVLGIAKHELMDYWRKKYAKRVVRTVPFIKDLPVTPYRSDTVSQAIDAAIEQAYAKLHPVQAQLLRWKYEEGKSVKEMAELLGVTAKSIEAQLYRARKAFQAVYVAPAMVEG